MLHKLKMFIFLHWGAARWAKALRALMEPTPAHPAKPRLCLDPLELLQSAEEPGQVIQPEGIDWALDQIQTSEMQASEKLRQLRLQVACASADAGIGPQRWDREWIQNKDDHGSDVSYMTDGWGWHKLQDLIEVLDWALASPQGQRAQAHARDPNNMGAATLELIQQMRLELRNQCHQLLVVHAEVLDYSDDLMEALSSALNEARCLN
jgi:hypothetical protein